MLRPGLVPALRRVALQRLPWGAVAAAVFVCLATAPPPARAGDRIAVAWDDAAAQGRLAALESEPPYAFVTPELVLAPDARLRAGHGRLLHLSRATGVLSVIDPGGWAVVATHDLGAGSQPRDVAILDARTVYVTRRDASHLARLDLETGTLVDAVDLSPLGAGRGDPAQDSMLIHDGRLYVQLAVLPSSEQPHALAVVDIASETLVDADPAAPGIQGIGLAGTGPRFKMQVVPGANQLLVSATGAFHDFGGIERIDLDALTSLGLVVREQLDEGADIGAFVQIDASLGWFVFSTDLLLSSHLTPYTLQGGPAGTEVDLSLHYFAPHLLYVPGSHTLFWPEPDGVQPFDATTGDALAPATFLAGSPTDLEPLRGPAPVPAVPGAVVLALAFAAALGLGAVARARATRAGSRARADSRAR